MVVVYVMVWWGDVCRVGWAVCGARLCLGVVAMQLVGVTVVLGHQGVGAGGDGRVVVVLVVPCPLALRVWWSSHGVDVCGRWWLAWLQGWDAAVRWWWWALVGAVLLVCHGGLGVGWCGVAGPGPWSGCRALLAGALAGPPTCFGLLCLVGAGGG